jgi:hypothetical protein
LKSTVTFSLFWLLHTEDFFLLEVFSLKYNDDFTVEAMPKRSYGHKQRAKPFYAKEEVMDTSAKQFKNSQDIREYWRVKKQEERARANTKTEAKEK